MNSIIRNNIKSIKSLCLKHNVRSLELFGSANTNKFNELSDIDFVISFNDMPAVEYADAFFNLKKDLEQLLGRKVDILTQKSLSNPYLISSINKTKVLIYGQPN